MASEKPDYRNLSSVSPCQYPNTPAKIVWCQAAPRLTLLELIHGAWMMADLLLTLQKPKPFRH